jgi:hypothetical protein
LVGAECEVERQIPGLIRRVSEGKLHVHAYSAVPSTEKRMSFADIRARRQAKEARSHLPSSSASEKNSSSPPVEHPAENLFDALPSSTEIRTSLETGRGIYSKERVKRSK